MGENRPYAFHLQVKYQLVKVPRFLQEGILDQQMVVGQIPDIAGLKPAREELVDTVFGRVAYFDVVSSSLQFGMKLFHGRVDGACVVFKSCLRHMGTRDYPLDTPALHTLDKVGRGGGVGAAVVYTRHDMAMYIGGETKLHRIF